MAVESRIDRIAVAEACRVEQIVAGKTRVGQLLEAAQREDVE